MIAKFRCMACAHEWSGLPGPNKRPPHQRESNPDTVCPACGSLYMAWLNFGEMRNVRANPDIPKPLAKRHAMRE